MAGKTFNNTKSRRRSAKVQRVMMVNKKPFSTSARTDQKKINGVWVNIRVDNNNNLNGTNWTQNPDIKLFRIALKQQVSGHTTYYYVQPIMPLIIALWNNESAINPYQYFSEFNLKKFFSRLVLSGWSWDGINPSDPQASILAGNRAPSVITSNMVTPTNYDRRIVQSLGANVPNSLINRSNQVFKLFYVAKGLEQRNHFVAFMPLGIASQNPFTTQPFYNNDQVVTPISIYNIDVPTRFLTKLEAKDELFDAEVNTWVQVTLRGIDLAPLQFTRIQSQKTKPIIEQKLDALISQQLMTSEQAAYFLKTKKLPKTIDAKVRQFLLEDMIEEEK